MTRGSRRWSGWLAAALFAFATPAFAQEGEPAPGEEDELTPERAMELLNEALGLMHKSGELLNNASRGRALETEKEVLELLEKEFANEPEALQKRILEKIRKIMQRAEGRQKDAIERLNEIIRKAKS